MPELLSLTPAALILALLLCAAALLWWLHRRARQQVSLTLAQNTRQLALLRQLLTSLQRHRGLSTGLLSGDESMRAKLTDVRTDLDRHFATAQSLTSRHSERWQGLADHWSRLRQAENLNLANNLTQHNQIIRNAIYLIEDIALEQDLSQGRSELSYLPWIWRDVILAAEWAGQARAMGTGIAAAEASSPGQRVRMRFLHQQITQLSHGAFERLKAQEGSNQAMTAQVSRSQTAVNAFLNSVDQDLLSQARPTTSAQAFFNQATLAVDELLALVDLALEHLNRVHPQ